VLKVIRQTALTFSFLYRYKMDKEFFFRVWNTYHTHWGKEEQQEIKKRYSASLLEKKLKKSSSINALLYMFDIFRDDIFEYDYEVLRAIKNMSRACMEEEDLCEEEDSYTRMNSDFHLYHHFGVLSVAQRQWMSLRKSRGANSIVLTDENIYNLSAILVLPTI